jgi:ABC-type branched-subunit amino acid transport system ATPase component/sugar phosphate permease
MTPVENGDEAAAPSVELLTRAVLDEEASRLAEQAAASEARVLDEAELPGVGDDAMSLREGVAVGGLMLLAVISALNAVDQLDGGVVGVLAPDIRKSLHMSNAVISVATVGGSLFLIAGGLVMGLLADRMSRTRIIGISTIAWGVLSFFTGVVSNALLYFLARALTGIGRSNTTVVQGPVMADAYPIASRARVSGVHQIAGRVGGLVLPLAVGGMVTLIGGTNAWRWGFIVVAVPTIILGFAALGLKDPPRGQFEQLSTLGEVLEETDGPPMSLSATYQRVMQIKTYKNAMVAFTALGFGFVAIPIFGSLYLDEHFGLSAFQRALIGTMPGVLGIAVVPFVAKRADTLYRKSPTQMLTLIGALFIPSGVIITLQMAMPNAWLYGVCATVGGVVFAAQFAMMPPLFAAVNPYYLRAQGTAIGMALILGVGGFGGALVGALLQDGLGLRWTIVAIGLPSNIVGGLLMMNGARFVRNDMSMIVEEMREVREEHRRLTSNPDDRPMLQLRNIDYSYGPVQVLFDVNLDVRRGETLALLGTNGAGKSTVLRVISGLGIPSRGVVRLNGHTVTLCSAETRVKWGIHQLSGGKAIFSPMSVGENLEMAGFLYRREPGDRAARRERVLGIFPELRDRLGDRAGDLSGGQQQMLGLSMALMHDPEILLIDELSLGLAPVMVQQLLAVVDRLKAAGQTMIIVEQSLNVALAIADRAVFMEKGRIRFEGSGQDLLARDDLVRAVFLGTEQA